jgi:hypothetical protein
MTMACPISSAREFRERRKSVHNVVAYQRRRCSWWHSVGIWGWHDGAHVHGIVELGSITPSEFTAGLRRLGDVRLRPLDIETVRTEVYEAARSVSTIQQGHAAGRYQPFKIAIKPVTSMALAKPLLGNALIVPMPMLL